MGLNWGFIMIGEPVEVPDEGCGEVNNVDEKGEGD